MATTAPQTAAPTTPGCKLGVLGEGYSPDAKISKGGIREAEKNWLVVSNIFYFSPLFREMIQFDEYFFRWAETTN